MSTYTVGQEVILRTPRYRLPVDDKTVTIARVGRKYAYVVIYSREVPFHLDTGIEAGPGNYLSKIGTLEDFAERDAHTAALARLRDLTSGYSWMNNLSRDALTRLADIIEGEG